LAQNTVFVELGGNGFFYSINYERSIIQNLFLRIGFSYVPLSGENRFTTIPLILNCNIGEESHRFEVGLGITGFIADSVRPVFTGRLGYSYQPLEGGFNFKIAYTPFFSRLIFAPIWSGISIGWGF
jgi:hypothetical protein